MVGPLKANPPLIVNANAVLALAVAYQRFKTVPRQCGKVPKRRSRFHTVKLQARGSFKYGECLDPFPGGEFSGPLVPIADDHYPKIPESTPYVKRKGKIPSDREQPIAMRVLPRSPAEMTVITQWSSFFLLCIGVQIARRGIKALLESGTLYFG